MKKPSSPFPKIVDSDAAKNTKALLDIISLAGVAASALSIINTKIAEEAPPVLGVQRVEDNRVREYKTKEEVE